MPEHTEIASHIAELPLDEPAPDHDDADNIDAKLPPAEND